MFGKNNQKPNVQANTSPLDKVLHNDKFDISQVSNQNKAFACIVGVLFLIALSLGFTHNSLSMQADNADLALSQAQNKHAELTHVDTQIISTPNGQVDEGAAETIKNINKLFTTLTTYISATQYQNNFKNAQQTVLDKSFFTKSGFLTPLDDQNNPENSSMAINKIKSEPNFVHTYQLSSGQYIVMISQYMYHNPADLNYKSKLETTNTALLVTGTANHITQVQNLNLPNLTN